MTGSSLDVSVNLDGAEHGVRVPSEVIETAVTATLIDAGVARAEVSVTLLSDDAIRDLNGRYLQKDRPTDVIAFTLGDDSAVLGDVYIGLDQAVRQAAEHGVDITEELVRLAIHGTLHVLGHDHPDGPERVDSAMFVRQEQLVRRVLADRAGASRG